MTLIAFQSSDFALSLGENPLKGSSFPELCKLKLVSTFGLGSSVSIPGFLFSGKVKKWKPRTFPVCAHPKLTCCQFYRTMHEIDIMPKRRAVNQT